MDKKDFMEDLLKVARHIFKGLPIYVGIGRKQTELRITNEPNELEGINGKMFYDRPYILIDVPVHKTTKAGRVEVIANLEKIRQRVVNEWLSSIPSYRKSEDYKQYLKLKKYDSFRKTLCKEWTALRRGQLKDYKEGKGAAYKAFGCARGYLALYTVVTRTMYSKSWHNAYGSEGSTRTDCYFVCHYSKDDVYVQKVQKYSTSIENALHWIWGDKLPVKCAYGVGFFPSKPMKEYTQSTAEKPLRWGDGVFICKYAKEKNNMYVSDGTATFKGVEIQFEPDKWYKLKDAKIYRG